MIFSLFTKEINPLLFGKKSKADRCFGFSQQLISCKIFEKINRGLYLFFEHSL